MDALSHRFRPLVVWIGVVASLATIVTCVVALIDRRDSEPGEIPQRPVTPQAVAVSPPSTPGAVPTSEPSIPDSPGGPGPSPPDPVAQQPVDLAGTWVGYYRCGSGRSGLRLVLTPVEERTFRATLDFYPLPGEPTIESGTFAMRGTHSRYGIVLVFDYWIDQPRGYVAYGLSAEFTEPAPARIEGSVNSSSCSTFAVEKESDEWHTPVA